MAKKKVTTTTTEETVEEPKVPEEYAETHDKTLEEVVTEAHTETTEETPVESVPKTTPPTEETKVETKEVEFDPNQFKQEVADETTKKIVTALQGGDKKETEEKVDAYTEWAQQYSKETGKQPTWVEAAKFIKDQAKAEIRAEEEAARKETEVAQAKANEDQNTRIQQSNQFIGKQISELMTGGRLPKIQDENNASDLGVIARHAFLQDYTTEVTSIAESNKGKTAEEMNPIPTPKEFFFEKFKGVKKQVAGGDAPVSGGDYGADLPKDDDEIDYLEMHNSKLPAWVNKVLGK